MPAVTTPPSFQTTTINNHQRNGSWLIFSA